MPIFQPGSVADSSITFSDITTNDVSTTKHGFAPKAPNDATKYLDGTGAYSVPASPGAELFYAQVTTNVTVSSTSEASPNDVVSLGAQTYDGSDIYLEFFAPEIEAIANNDGTAAFIFMVWDATTELCRFVDARPIVKNGLGITVGPIFGRLKLTPSAGSHTYKVRALKSGNIDNATLDAGSGSGGSGVHSPIYLRAIKA